MSRPAKAQLPCRIGKCRRVYLEEPEELASWAHEAHGIARASKAKSPRKRR